MVLPSPAATEFRPEIFTNPLADALASVEQAARSNGAEALQMANRFLADHAVQLLQDAGLNLHYAEKNIDLLWFDRSKSAGAAEENPTLVETLSLARPEDRPFIAFFPFGDAITCLVVPHGAGQISSQLVPKIGLHELDFRELTLALNWERFSLGKKISNEAVKKLCAHMAAEKWLLFSGVILGVSQRAFEYVVDYARKRTTFGKAIGHHQAVGLRLADIAIALESCRLLCQQTCVSGNRHRQLLQQTYDIWQYIKDTTKDIAPQIMQVMGGHGYLQRHPVQQWFCDLQLLLLAGEIPDSFMDIFQND
jgi:hypothetical protein